MHILLGNTGRGGELCLFTSIIKAYRQTFPKAHIAVATNPYYHPMFENSDDINKWYGLQYKDPSDKSTYLNPVGAWNQFAKKYKHEHDALVEFACEYDYSPSHDPHKKSPTDGNSSLYNCYLRIEKKMFDYQDIPKKVFIYPTEDEKQQAKDIANYIDDLILIAYVANSANPVLGAGGFRKVGLALKEYGTVCYTGRPKDPALQGLHDLRGLSFGTLYALADNIKWFLSPDTSLPFVIAHTPGGIITLRNDKKFPLSNTGSQAMGYRCKHNTWELETTESKAHNKVLKIVRENA